MGRLQIIDVLRGYALVCIMIDHIPASVMAEGSLSKFAVFDAAELFVFLSGFVVAGLWEKLEARSGVSACRRRFAWRAWEIYRAYVLTALAAVGLSALLTVWAIEHTAIWTGYGEALLASPARTVVEIASLYVNPNLVDVLTLYVFLLAVTPLALPFLRSAPVTFFGISLAIWAFSEPLNAMLPTGREEGGFLFNPFAWQFLFFSAALIATYRRDFGRLVGRRDPILITACLIIFCAGTLYRVGANEGFGEHSGLFDAFAGAFGDVDKWNLDAFRYLAFMAGACLLAVVGGGRLGKLSETWPGRALSLVGRQGLVSFAACVILSILGDAVAGLLEFRGKHLTVDLVAVAALLAVAWVARNAGSLARAPAMRMSRATPLAGSSGTNRQASAEGVMRR